MIYYAEVHFAKYGVIISDDGKHTQPYTIDLFGQYREVLAGYFRLNVAHALALAMWEESMGELIPKLRNTVYKGVRDAIPVVMREAMGPVPEDAVARAFQQAEIAAKIDEWDTVFANLATMWRADVESVLAVDVEYKVLKVAEPVPLVLNIEV